MRSHADWAAENVREELGDELLAYLASPLLRAGAAGDEVADPRCIDAMETVVDCLVLAEENADKDMVAEAILSIFQVLSEREREVIMTRFGLDGYEPSSLEDTARLLGLSSREPVRQIEANALRRLRFHAAQISHMT